MLESPALYPMLAGRRRRRRLSARARSILGGWIGKALLALLLIAGVTWGVMRLAERASLPDSATALRDGEAALARANYSAARNHFIDATRAEPANGAAQRALATAYILLGDGVPAEGAVTRAAQAGVPAAALHHLRAAALLLQGDADAALREAAQSKAPHVADARRVRAAALAAKGDPAGAMATLQGVLAADPRDAKAWRDLARIRFDNGDVGGAGEAVQRALALDGDDLDALVLRGETVRSQYGLAAALPWFEAALRRDAYFHAALVEYAGTLGDIGRYSDSLAAARRALAARPGSPQALYQMAVIAARAGNMPLAGSLLDRTGGALDGLPGGLLLSGGVDYAAGRYEQAAVKWRALVARQPMNMVARRLLGAALLRSGDAAGTLATLRPIALRGDADSYTLTLVARAFEAQGQREWAARFLDRAAQPGVPGSAPFGQDDDDAVLADTVAEHPDDPGAIVGVVRGLIERGEDAAALARATAMARVAAGAPAAQLLVGDVLAAQGKWGPAASTYARAADLRFDRATLLRLVEAWGRAGTPARAADAVALYAAQAPVDPAARRVVANLQLASGDARSAIATLEALRTDLGGRDAVLLTQLADAYSTAGDPQAALPYARAAYRLQPMSAAASHAYGRALFDAGDTAAALQLLDKAVRIAPGATMTRWHLAQALADAGRTVAAKAAIAAAMRDPAFPERAAATKLLAALG